LALSTGWHEQAGHQPCGRSIDSLWEHLLAGEQPDSHIATCAHCRTTLVGLRALDAAKRALASERIAAPPTLVRRIMRTVRTEARNGTTVPLVTGPDPARVSAKAIAAVVRFAVNTMPNARLRAGQCDINAPAGTVDMLDVTVEITAPPGRGIDQESLGRRVDMVIMAQVGLRLRELNLTVSSAPARPRATHVDETARNER
jgi:hypothetical protein